GYSSGGAALVWGVERLLGIPARRRLLSGGIVDLVGSGRENSPAQRRRKVVERLLREVSRWAGRRACAEALHVRSLGGGLEFDSGLRLGRFLQRSVSLHFAACSIGRH